MHQTSAAMLWLLSMQGISVASNISYHVMITFKAKNFCGVKHQLRCQDHSQCMDLPPRQSFTVMSWLLSTQRISAASNISYHVMIILNAKNFYCVKHQLPCLDHFQCKELLLRQTSAAMSWSLSMCETSTASISAASNISCHVMITFNAWNFHRIKLQLPCHDRFQCKELPRGTV